MAFNFGFGGCIGIYALFYLSSLYGAVLRGV